MHFLQSRGRLPGVTSATLKMQVAPSSETLSKRILQDLRTQKISLESGGFFIEE
jgi:hypothetical protein